MSQGKNYILKMIVDVQGDQDLKKVSKAIDGVGSGLGKANNASKQMTKGNKAFNYQMQNMSYQMADFAVQTGVPCAGSSW